MKPTTLALAALTLIASARCSNPPASSPAEAGAPSFDAAPVRPPAIGTLSDAAAVAPDSGPHASGPDAPATTPDAGPPTAPPDARLDTAGADAGAPDGAARTLASRSVGYARSSLGNLPALAAIVDLRKLTHLIITFANPSATAPLALSSSDADVATLVSAGHAAGIKVLVAIGGASGTVRVLPELTPARLPAFVQTVVAFADKHGFDGVDVDVEDASVSPASYEALVMGLSAALVPRQKLVTAAVARWFDRQIRRPPWPGWTSSA